MSPIQPIMPQPGGIPISGEQLADIRAEEWETPSERDTQGQFNREYWEKPENLGKWHDLFSGMQPGETPPEWLDTDGLKIAYDYLSQMNNGKPWSSWDNMPGEDDPIWGYLQTLTAPPEERPPEIQVPNTPRGTYGQPLAIPKLPGYETFGYTQEEWDSLSPWQQWAERIFNTGSTGNILTGAVAGLQGGLPGAITGGILGALVTPLVTPPAKSTYEGQYPGAAAVSQTYWDPERANIITKIFEALNLGAMITKQAAGTASLLGLSALGEVEEAITGETALPDFGTLMRNINVAWDVSKLAYRVLPNQEILKAAATPMTPRALVVRFGERAAQQMIKDLKNLGLELPKETGEILSRVEPYLEGNVWKLIYEANKGKPETAWTMGTTEVRELQPSEIGYQAFVEAYDRVLNGESMESVFKEYQERYGFEGDMRDLFGEILADPLNFSGVALAKGGAKAAKIGRFSNLFVESLDSSHGLIEGLRKYRETAKLVQSAEEFSHLNSVEKWLSGAWTKEGQARILAKPEPKNPIEKAWGYTFSLTDEARAKEVTDGMGLNLTGVIDRAEYDPVTSHRFIEGIAASDPRVAAEIGLKSLGGSEAAALPVALRDWTPKGRALIEAWTANEWSRDVLNKLAKVTGRSVDDILKSLDDVTGKQADVIARQMADTARTSADEAAQTIAKMYDAGEITGETLQDFAKTYLKDKAPLTQSDFMQRYFTGMMDHVESWTANYFGVKPDPWLFRFSNLIKNAQGMAMLDLSPNYLFQNGIDNVFKLGYEGVLGFDSAKRKANFWERFGVKHPRMGETFIQREKTIRGAIAESKIQAGPMETLSQGIRSLRKKIGLASEASSKLEAWSSETAMYHGVKEAMNYLWKPGRGFDPVPVDIERFLGADAARMIERRISAGMSKAEIERSLFEAVGRKTIDDVLPDVSRTLGIDEAMAKTALEKTGAYDYLKENIPANPTDADIRKAFNGLQKHISEQFDDWAKRRMAAEVEKAKNAAKAESALGIIDLYDDVALDEAVTHIGGYDGWERIFEMQEFVSSSEFSKMIQEQRKVADAKWQRSWNRKRANYLGITEQLGLESRYARAVESNLIAQEQNWSDFHNLKWDIWNETKKSMGTADWAIVRDEARARIRAAFEEASRKEIDLQRALDTELVNVLEAWYGPEIGELARAWRDGVRGIREQMTAEMLTFRERIEGLKPDKKNAAWNKFLNETYKPAIIEKMRQNIAGAHELWQRASKMEPIPPKAGDITPAMQWVEEARRQLFEKKYGLTPEQVSNVNEIRRIASEFGVASAKADGSPDPGFNKHLLGIVKKYTGETAGKVEDLPPEVVRRAFEERAKGEMAAGTAPLAELSVPEAETTALADQLERAHITDAAEEWRKQIGFERRSPEMESLRRQIEELQAERTRLVDENIRLKTDELTGLPDGRKLTDAIDKAPVKVAFDIGGVKYVNDVWSYPSGDEMFRMMGAALRKTGYEVYRFGGDEFIAVFKSLDEAQAAMPILRDAIQETPVILEGPQGREVVKGFPAYMGIGDTKEAAFAGVDEAKSAFRKQYPNYSTERLARPPSLERVASTIKGDPDPVGIAPPGTVEGLYDPDLGKLLEDGWDENIYGLLNQVQDNLMGDRGQAVNLKDINLTPEQMKQFRRYLELQYARLSDTKLAATKYGITKRDTALLNYNRRYGFDNMLGVVMPYQFWYTRSAVNWALRAIDHPAYILQYGRIRNAQEQMSREQPGFPSRLRGKMAIPFPWLPEGWGNTIYIDPLRQVFSFESMVGQTVRPLQRDQANQFKKAEYILQEMAEQGFITEQQVTEAIDARTGPLWEQALTQAKMEVESEIANPLDLVNTMSAFSWPIQLAYQKIMGRESKINPVPSLQAITNLSSFVTPGGINASGWLQKALGAPDRGFLFNYYVERELRNMAIRGEADPDEITEAMVDQSGELWTRAVDRIGKQQAVRSYTSLILLDFFPEGEQQARQLQQEFYEAMENGNGAAFFDAHPEYEAQLLLSDWDDPEERLKRYLISATWEGWNSLSKLEQREAKEQLGELFSEAFLNKETRSYDSIDLETITMWASMLGQDLPETAPEVRPPELELPEAETSAKYQTYLDTIRREFPNIQAIQDMYYKVPEGMQFQFLENHPELRQYWEWRDQFIANNLDLIPYMVGENSRYANAPLEVQEQIYLYKGEKIQYFPEIDAIQAKFYSLQGAERKAYLLDHPELRAYWDWQEERLGQTPAIIPYIKSSETIAKSVLGKSYKETYRVNANLFDRVLSAQIMTYAASGAPLSEEVQTELRQIWKREKTDLTFSEWLEQVYKLFEYK